VTKRMAAMLAGLTLVAAATSGACADGDGDASASPGSSTTSSSGDEAATSSTTAPTSSSTVPAGTTPAAPDPPAPGQPVVVIDPGHNGRNGEHPEVINQPVDAGGFEKACNTTGTATDDGYTESQFNLEVSLQLRDTLQAAGVQVILTRTDDEGVGPCVDERGQTAARAGAAALVSIHADGADAGSSGFHVIHPGLREGYTDDTVEPSSQLATSLRDELVAAGFSPSDYAGSEGLQQRDDLGTLNRAEVPAVMLESGNMRDADDAATLRSADGQQRLVDALAAAVLDFVQP
jgi:N-acetylmuramoyl-L-alanine amidase